MSNWFKVIIPEEKLHPKFIHLSNFAYLEEKNLVSEWITRFVNKDGNKKTITQFQESFHSMIWELYLNEAIITSSTNIIKDENKESVDFFIQKNNQKANIEAVVSNISDSSPKESERTLNDIYGNNDYYKIINESIPRLLNSIINKSKHYEKHYIKNSNITDNPFVLAISDHAQINSGQSSYYPLLNVLYNAYYDPEDRENLKIYGYDNLDHEYKYKDTYLKSNGTQLELGLFSTEKYKHISAIIYSCTMTLGKLTSLCVNHSTPKFIVTEWEEHKKLRYSNTISDESLLDGLFIFHNPYAEKEFSNDFFNQKGITNIYFNEDDCDEFLMLNTKERYSPLVRRYIGVKGDEFNLIKDIDEFMFIPTNITNHWKKNKAILRKYRPLKYRRKIFKRVERQDVKLPCPSI